MADGLDPRCETCSCFACVEKCRYTGDAGCSGRTALCPWDGDPSGGKDCPATCRSFFDDLRMEARYVPATR